MSVKKIAKIAGLLTLLGGTFVGFIYVAGKVEEEMKKELKSS